ncbi:MAG TPA: GAF domain-containing SpoIIE family protein phosphatase [Haliangiales bacterium]|nr:GAF domain-containing SpoIIE family protein phosphatase [Haliangiales bacterium]
MQQLGILYRTPARIVAAQTEAELRDLLASTLRGLYRSLVRYELFVKDERGDLVPAVHLGEGQHETGMKLLSSVKLRLAAAAKDEPGDLSQAHLFPALHAAKRGSLMSAPLLDAGAVIGLCVVEGGPAAPSFTAFDLDLLQGVAALFSLALQRLRSKETQNAHASVEKDLKSARNVQRRFMSQPLPKDTGVTVDAEYLPAFDVGGDFYEIIHLGDGQIGGAIGDVSGKGVSAALVMARVSSEVRRALRSGVSPARVLKYVNGGLTKDVESETFVTASSIRLDARARKLTVANAGHIPMIVRRASGETFTFGPPSGTPLGMMDSEYSDDVLDLEPLDIVLLMTDGLVDALDRPSDRMGMELLLGLIRYAPHDPKLINARILEAVGKMKGTKPLDDVTLVALQLQG